MERKKILALSPEVTGNALYLNSKGSIQGDSLWVWKEKMEGKSIVMIL